MILQTSPRPRSIDPTRTGFAFGLAILSAAILSAAIFPAAILSAAILSVAILLPTANVGATGLGATKAENATWAVLGDDALLQQLRTSLDRLGLSAEASAQISMQFTDLLQTGTLDPLDAWVDSLRTELPIVQSMVAMTNSSAIEAAKSLDPGTPVYQSIEALPESIRMSVRTWVARELVRGRFYDEALPVIAEVDPIQTVDPAAVLFYRGVCYHALLMKKEALADLRRLLEREDEIPRRYSRTASMMIADIKPLKEDSLDEISRLMTDVSRRLDLGRSDEKVEQREQLIIDKLTKLIEDLEEQQKKQQQQQQQSGQGGEGGEGGDNPANQSNIADTKGEGDINRKNLGQVEGWGNLPPAQRKEAIQKISRDLPTHYREAIEAYFRKLAKTQ